MSYRLFGLVALAVAFAGVGIGIGGVYFGVFFAALLLIIPLLAVPIETVLWGEMVLTFLVAGQLQYFAHVSKAFWLPYLFGALLFLRIALDRLAVQQPRTAGNGHLPLTSLNWLGLFALLACASSVFNTAPLLQVLLSAKEYFFLWSILIILGIGMVSEQFFDRMWKAMLWLVPLHIPIVAYQRFVVAAHRSTRGDAEGFDAVVGLFGGAQETGGATGGMGIFLLFTILLAISFWRQRRIGIATMIALSTIALLCILLAEIKLIILLLPVSIAIMYRKEVLRRPGRALLMLAVAMALTALMAVMYQWQYADKSTGAKGPFAYLEKAIDTNTNDDFFNPATGEIGRVASIKFWWKQHGWHEPLHFLLGHGIGATRYGTIMGEQASKNRFYRIDRSSGVVFLWETGLLGTAAFVAFLISAIRSALKVSKMPNLSPAETTVIAAITPILFLQLLILIYNNELNALPAIQLLVMMMIGQVEYTRRRLARMGSLSQLPSTGQHASENPPQRPTPAFSSNA